MDKKTTQREFTGSSSVLYLAFELSSMQWKLDLRSAWDRSLEFGRSTVGR